MDYEKMYNEVCGKYIPRIRELEEENKKLEEERDDFMLKYAKALEEKIVETNELCTERNKLEQENKKLKEELDKFSDAYKRYRDYEKEELAESCYDFARENDELKKKLESLEK